MLLALDISIEGTGVAWGKSGARPQSTVWKLPAGKAQLTRALGCLRQSVFDLSRHIGTRTVVLEAWMQRIDRKHGAYTHYCLTSLQAVAREAGASAGAAVELVDVATWRKHFLGRGDLSTDDAKAGAIARCRQLNYPFADHNAAEACGMWDWGIAKFYSRAGTLV